MFRDFVNAHIVFVLLAGNYQSELCHQPSLCCVVSCGVDASRLFVSPIRTFNGGGFSYCYGTAHFARKIMGVFMLMLLSLLVREALHQCYYHYDIGALQAMWGIPSLCGGKRVRERSALLLEGVS